ncbi:hypothetical protein EXU48_12795 [Occultella glacieicola]|uniref:Uncharacterized protein n=1 Tax=Occultella glacieicola TaxID=2518684 RepID=A0ABY2E1H5_9MICO|nr:hypothetical protein [Occultella glacieicola]TDE92442.1 hypothetical protein EXU48_12795 [Occultella glacieicola]
MLSEYETRLADLLGSRLGAPFDGRVFVPPGPSATNEPALLAGLVDAVPIPESFGSRRPEIVPGADDPRRVVRMRTTARVEVRASTAGGREETTTGLDALLYLLDAPDLRDASAFTAPGDPGFALSRQVPTGVQIAPDAGLPAVLVEAEGWFWPPNVSGVTGRPIRQAHVRMAQLPVALEPWPPPLDAGGPAVDLRVTVGAVGTMRLDGGTPAGVAFGALTLRVVDAGGRPGAGTLTGGAGGIGGTDGNLVVPLEAGAASFTYTPPAEPARDVLVVSLDRPDTGDGVAIGTEIARFDLVVA